MIITFVMASLIVSMTLAATTTTQYQSVKAQQPPTATQLPIFPQAPSTTQHLPVQTVQDHSHIVTTVTKTGEAPTGPIVIIPPVPGGGENGTILTPGENVSGGVPENVTIVAPDGNVTEIPNGNVTVIDNETVIITAPPERNITETPGNVTIIDPPHIATLPVFPTGQQPANCTCNQTNQPIPPVVVTPAPGQNITTGEPPRAQQLPTLPLPPTIPNNAPPQIQQLPSLPAAGNQTGNSTGNEVQTLPANNSTSNNSTTPVNAVQIFPGFHINKVSYAYNGVNSEFLNK